MVMKPTAHAPLARAHPWLFPDGAVFPVVSGDLHPLKLHAQGLLGRGILFAVALHFMIFGAWLIQRGLSTGELPIPVMPGVERVVELIDVRPPPPIQTQINPAVTQPELEAIAATAVGVPVPVIDFQAPDTPYKSTEDWVHNLTPVVSGDLGGGNESIVISMPLTETDPDPREFVPVEEEPYPVQSPAPVYPEMARAAEVEGMVRVRALVNKEGRIEKAFIVSGHPMLDEAALAAVRAWVFKPALQQHRPVKVWVTIPIKFVLH
jgi:protein TonB